MSNAQSPPTKPDMAVSPIYAGGTPIEAIQKKYGLEDVIKLASNENPLGTSAHAIQAIQAAVATLNRYPPMSDEALREALAHFNGRATTAEHYVTGNGGCDILDLVAQAYLEEEDQVIICPPTFPVYELTAKRVGAEIVSVNLADDYAYDVEAVLAAVTERTKVIYVCSPNNPTGSYITAAQMNQLMQHVPEHVLVLSDEVYNHFATAPDFADSFAHVRAGKNILILHSFSKVFGLAGLRLGYGIAKPDIAHYLSRARLPFHLNKLTMVGAMAGLQDAQYIEQSIDLTVTGRAYLLEQLQALGIAAWPSQANFVLFKTEKPGAEVAEQLQQRGVIVRELSGFYMPGYLRVTVGRPEENERFMTTLQQVLDA